MRSPLALLTIGLLAACGDDGTNKLADAGPIIDSPKAIDAAPTDTGPQEGVVTLTVTVDGAPAPAVKVYFLNADSSVVSNTATGSDGVASATMAAGGSVTAIEPVIAQPAFQAPSQSDTLDTFEGVKPGDQLHIDLGSVPSDPGFAIDVVVPNDPAATTYDFDSTCTSFEQDITPPLTPPPPPAGLHAHAHAASRHVASGLHPSSTHGKIVPFGLPANNDPVTVNLDACPGGTADIVITTFDTDGIMLGSIFAPAVAVADGATVTIAGPYVAPGTFAATFANMPADATSVSFTKRAATTAGPLYSAQSSADLTAGSGSGSLAFPVTAAPGQAFETSFDATIDSQDGLDFGLASDTVTYDGAAELLPEFTAQPTFDPATATATWTEGTATRAVDAVTLRVDLDRTTTDGSGGTIDNSWFWIVSAPGSAAGAIKLPALPTDVFDYNPAATDTFNFLEVNTWGLPGGYDAFRPLGTTLNFTEDVFAAISVSGPGSIQNAFADNFGSGGTLLRSRPHRGAGHLVKRHVANTHAASTLRTRWLHR